MNEHMHVGLGFDWERYCGIQLADVKRVEEGRTGAIGHKSPLGINTIGI
jgi:hypothetical protein